MTIPAGTSKNVLCEVNTNDEWCAQPVLIESATSNRNVKENLINEVNTRAIPMSGAYNVKDNKEVYVHFCNLSHQPVQVERSQIMAVFDTLVQPPVYSVDNKLEKLQWWQRKQI